MGHHGNTKGAIKAKTRSAAMQHNETTGTTRGQQRGNHGATRRHPWGNNDTTLKSNVAILPQQRNKMMLLRMTMKSQNVHQMIWTQAEI